MRILVLSGQLETARFYFNRWELIQHQWNQFSYVSALRPLSICGEEDQENLLRLRSTWTTSHLLISFPSGCFEFLLDVQVNFVLAFVITGADCLGRSWPAQAHQPWWAQAVFVALPSIPDAKFLVRHAQTWKFPSDIIPVHFWLLWRPI